MKDRFGKKRIVVVEDELINRMMLVKVLEDEYELFEAGTGEEALSLIRENADSLSLVLLDLNLPDMSGMDILREIKSSEELQQIPVIVITADREAEVDSLNIGASDFIPKPYPKKEVIHARVKRTIELSEDRVIIGKTERDDVTGLFTREFFYSYAEQFDTRNKGLNTDAIAVNINHFRMINERFGKTYGDEILGRIGSTINRIADECGGLACRRDADNFFIYCLHRDDYSEMLERITEEASYGDNSDNVIRLRMGIYPDTDKTLDIERRFDRAKLAADTVKSTFTMGLAIYDSKFHQTQMFEEQLLMDFQSAIDEEQFKLYFQPKYNIRGDEPVLSSAEALIRWDHPELGMISPGAFIGTFEKNGLISKMDNFVWRKAAWQIRDWHDRLGVTIPVSVNVSRVDLFDSSIDEDLCEMVKENDISAKDLLLEVTESAYTEDSEHIISKVKALREKGFFIEMDDFGSGYSSLNMLSNLPIDALKLDMQFIRNAFKNGKDTRMLEIVIEIAASLSVPVIAEGVENAEQFMTLKQMGCDIVQGYYFSKPVPAEQFEAFLLEKKDGKTVIPDSGSRRKYRSMSKDRRMYEAMHDPLTGLYNHSAFNMLLYNADRKNCTLMLVDIDGYEDIIEKQGLSATDSIVMRVADVLRNEFRASDMVCRLKADEFAVIMARAISEHKDLIEGKMEAITAALSKEKDGVAPVKVSFGVAFGDENAEGDIFTAADISLKGDR